MGGPIIVGSSQSQALGPARNYLRAVSVSSSARRLDCGRRCKSPDPSVAGLSRSPWGRSPTACLPRRRSASTAIEASKQRSSGRQVGRPAPLRAYLPKPLEEPRPPTPHAKASRSVEAETAAPSEPLVKHSPAHRAHGKHGSGAVPPTASTPQATPTEKPVADPFEQ